MIVSPYMTMKSSLTRFLNWMFLSTSPKLQIMTQLLLQAVGVHEDQFELGLTMFLNGLVVLLDL